MSDSEHRHRRGISPRQEHGTRVAFRITCERCGKDDTLPFVPKTSGALLCADCAEEEFGENWHRGRVEKPEGFPFDCAICGRAWQLEKEPERPGSLVCPRCLQGGEDANPERLDGEVVDGKGGVKKRRRKV